MNNFDITYINNNLDLNKHNVLNLFVMPYGRKDFEHFGFTPYPHTTKHIKLYYDKSCDANTIGKVKLHIEGDFNIYKFFYKGLCDSYYRRCRLIELKKVTDSHVILILTQDCFYKSMLRIGVYDLFPKNSSTIVVNELDAKIKMIEYMKYCVIENLKKIGILYKRMKNNKYNKTPIHFHCEFLDVNIHCIAKSTKDKDFVRLKKLFQYITRRFISTIQLYNRRLEGYGCFTLNNIEIDHLIESFNFLDFYIIKEALSKYQRSVSLDERNKFFSNFYKFKINLLCQHQKKEA